LESFELIALLLIGLFGGFVGGMLGVGGSVVMIPAMTEVLGPNQHLYQAAAMIVNFFVVVPAVYQHRRAKAIDGATVLRLAPLAGVAVIAGVGVSELSLFAGEGEAYLRGLFGLFLLYVVASELVRLFLSERRWSAETHEESRLYVEGRSARWGLAAAVAVPTGFVAGLLGVGGGIVAVPLQRRLLNVPMRAAVANSAAIIIATSLIGSVAKNYAYVTEHGHGAQSFVLAALLIPTAMIGSLNGAWLTHRMPLRVLKVAFFVLLLVAAVRLTYKAARSVADSRRSADFAARRTFCREMLPDTARHMLRNTEGSTFPAATSDTTSERNCAAAPNCGRRAAQEEQTPMSKHNPSRRSLLTIGSAVVIWMGAAAGCEVGREFRAAATPAVQSGVTQIVNGLMEGFFAAIEVDTPSDSGGS
jgi:uncharacterized membrane protein YfcA